MAGGARGAAAGMQDEAVILNPCEYRYCSSRHNTSRAAAGGSFDEQHQGSIAITTLNHRLA